MRLIAIGAVILVATGSLVCLSSGCQTEERSAPTAVSKATPPVAPSGSGSTPMPAASVTAVPPEPPKAPEFADWAGRWRGGGATYDPPSGDPEGGVSFHGFDHQLEIDANGRVSAETRYYAQSPGSEGRRYYRNQTSSGQLNRTDQGVTFTPDDAKSKVFPPGAIWRRTEPCLVTLFDPKRRGDYGRLYSLRQANCPPPKGQGTGGALGPSRARAQGD